MNSLQLSYRSDRPQLSQLEENSLQMSINTSFTTELSQGVLRRRMDGQTDGQADRLKYSMQGCA